MEILLIVLTCVVGLVFAIAVAMFYLGCLGATLAAFNNGRIVWGSLSFFLPPLALLYGIRNKQQVGWSYGFMVKGGAVVAILALLAWGGMHLLPAPANGGGQLMERLLPQPAPQ
ncbi:hypothetical protein ACFOKJ_14265 [Vogesella amnigena]|uniref:Uncharacterized protein n=1 Tax=Vogesella amnigena TaxID=1507449 RepID=A0ABV7TX01_9NEIS